MRLLYLFVLALGAALRLYGLNRESLWNDELSTMARLDPGPLSEIFWQRIADDVHPPGYLLLLSGWTALFGNGEIALRLPSVIAGISLLAVAYALTSRAFGRVAGLLTALFCAVSPLHIRYSQEARSFALVTCTILIAAWALVEVLHTPRLSEHSRREDLRAHARWTSVLALSGTLSAYLSYVGVLALAALLTFGWAVVLWRAKDRVHRLLTATLCMLVGYLPWSHGFWLHLKRGGLSWLDPPILADLYRSPAIALPLHGWALVIMAIALGALWSRDGEEPLEPTDPKRRTLQITLAVWLAFALPVGFYLKSIWSTPIYNDRNLLVIVPFLALGAAVGLARAVPGRMAVASGFAIAAVVLVHFLAVDRFYTSPIKQDFRGAAHLAAGWIRDGTADKVYCLAWNKRYFAYYLRKDGIERDPACSSRADKLLEKLAKARTREKAFAFIYGHMVPHAALWKQIRRDFVVLESHPLHKAGAALLQPK